MTFENDGHALRMLHAQILDAHDRYSDGLEQAANPAIAAFIEPFRALHAEHITELDRLMLANALEPREDGSWADGSQHGAATITPDMVAVEGRLKTEIFRGERMIVRLYGNALEAVTSDREAQVMLTRQKSDILTRIEPA